MRNKYEQMSLFDTYKSVCASMEEDKPKLFRLLEIGRASCRERV